MEINQILIFKARKDKVAKKENHLLDIGNERFKHAQTL